LAAKYEWTKVFFCERFITLAPEVSLSQSVAERRKRPGRSAVADLGEGPGPPPHPRLKEEKPAGR